jgi:hypothetical protein
VSSKKRIAIRSALTLALLTASLVGQVSPAHAAGSVVAYPLVNLDQNSNYTSSPTAASGISMTVGGTAVNVQDNMSVAQTRFAMSGSQPVAITVSGGVTRADIRPAAYGITPTVSGNTISFTLSQPSNFAVDINGITDRLLVFADPLEVNPPQPTDSNVANVMSFSGVKNDGTLCTAALQSALNYVSANHTTKPILYFPNGVYETATLNIPSNVEIYFHSGAVLLADPNINDYSRIAPDYADQVNVSALLLIRNVSNVTIFGRGVIDGGGYNMFHTYGQALRLEELYTSQVANNLTFNDVMFTNSLFYQSHIQGSNNVTLNNIKFNNPEGGPTQNDDGFKVNSSTNVRYNGGWISSRDDNITVAACCGTTEAIQSTSNINISNIVLDGSGSASADVRFAFTDYGHTVSDVTISNIYDIGRDRGETFLLEPAGSGYTYNTSWGGITLRDWDIEESDPLVHFNISGNGTPVRVSNFVLSNITMQGTSNNYVLGGPGMTFDQVHLSTIVVGGQRATWSTLGLQTNAYATNVDVDGVPPAPNLATSATSSTTSIRSGDTAAAANDGDPYTFFKSAMNPTFPQHETLTWTTPQSLSSVTYVCDYCQGQGLTNWDIQVSTDGSTNWTTVASSGNVGWSHYDGTRESHTVSFTSVSNIKGMRLKINGANLDFGQYQIDEVEVFGPTTTNLAPSASASTTSIRSGDSVATANDGNWSSFFKSAMNPSFPQYLTLTWASSHSITGVTYVCDWCQGQGLTNWDIQTSGDGTQWTTVASSGDVTWLHYDGTRELKLVSFPTVSNVVAIRLKINNAKLDFGQYQIDEIEVSP